MLNRLLSRVGGGTPTPNAAGVDIYEDDPDFLDALLAEAPTEEVVPDYIAEVPRDSMRHEIVGMTDEEIRQYMRPEEEQPGRGLIRDMVDSFGGLLDQVLLEPLRLFFGNLGFVVTGALVLAGICIAAAWIIELIMAPFAPLGT